MELSINKNVDCTTIVVFVKSYLKFYAGVIIITINYLVWAIKNKNSLYGKPKFKYPLPARTDRDNAISLLYYYYNFFEI